MKKPNGILCYKMLYINYNFNEYRDEIVEECDPNYIPKHSEQMGLRNIHIFGLANVLRRPIILLDSWSGMNNAGDYTGKL